MNNLREVFAGAVIGLVVLAGWTFATSFPPQGSGGGGGLTPPGSSTDNAVVRWDGAGADTVQDSSVLVDDSNNVTGVAGLTATSLTAGALDTSGAATLTLGGTNASDVTIAQSGVTTTVAGDLLRARVVTANTDTATPAASDSGTIYTNEGDADGSAITLPEAASGIELGALVQAAQTITVTAQTGDTIRIADGVTAGGGSISSSTVGDYVVLQAISASEWLATAHQGTWTIATAPGAPSGDITVDSVTLDEANADVKLDRFAAGLANVYDPLAGAAGGFVFWNAAKTLGVVVDQGASRELDITGLSTLSIDVGSSTTVDLKASASDDLRLYGADELHLYSANQRVASWDVTSGISFGTFAHSTTAKTYINLATSSDNSAAGLAFGAYTDVGSTHGYLWADVSANDTWILTEHSNYLREHGHTSITDPTLFIHSATDPEGDATQWLSLAHDQTDAVIESGTGDILLTAAGTRLPRSVEANTAVAAGPNVLATDESFKVLTNEGIAAQNYHTLPTAAAGLTYTFVVQDADGIRITPGTSDSIALNGAVGAVTTGYIESTQVGATVTLVAINATEWVATNYQGAWDVYDGAASNPATNLYGEFSMNGNGTSTGVITPGTPLKQGGTVVGGENRGFTVTTTSGGRLTYDGIATKKFLVTATVTSSADFTGSYSILYIAEGGTVDATTAITREVGTSGAHAAQSTQAVFTLATDEYVEVFWDVESGASPSPEMTSVNMTLTAVCID